MSDLPASAPQPSDAAETSDAPGPWAQEQARRDHATRRRRLLVGAGVVVALAVVTVVGDLPRRTGLADALGWTCGDLVQTQDPGDSSLVTRPWDTAASAVQGAAEALAADGTLGEPTAGFAHDASAPGVSELSPELALVSASSVEEGSDLAAMTPDGDLRWALHVETAATGSAGDGSYVIAAVTDRGQTDVVTFDVATGDRTGCTRLGTPQEDAPFDPALRVLVTESEVLVVHPDLREGDDEPDDVTVLTSLDRRTGETRWSTEIADVWSVGRMDVVDDTVLVTTSPRNWFTWDDLWDLGARIDQVHVLTVDLADGSVLRTSATGNAEIVVGTSTAGPVLLRTQPSGSGDDAHNALVGLGPDGEDTWEVSLRDGTYAPVVRVWDDVAVVQADGDGLVGLDTADGEERWAVPTRSDTADDLFQEADVLAGTAIDGTALVPDLAGYRAIDLASGAAHEVDVEGDVAAFDRIGDRVLVSWLDGFDGISALRDLTT